MRAKSAVAPTNSSATMVASSSTTGTPEPEDEAAADDHKLEVRKVAPAPPIHTFEPRPARYVASSQGTRILVDDDGYAFYCFRRLSCDTIKWKCKRSGYKCRAIAKTRQDMIITVSDPTIHNHKPDGQPSSAIVADGVQRPPLPKAALTVPTNNGGTRKRATIAAVGELKTEDDDALKPKEEHQPPQQKRSVCGTPSISAPSTRSKALSLKGITNEHRRIRVGADYQAMVEPFCGDSDAAAMLTDSDPLREETLWGPDDQARFSVAELDEYCTVARRHQQLQIDEALYALHKVDNSIPEALCGLEAQRPFNNAPAVWSADEVTLVERLVHKGSKPFRRVAKMLPRKTMANIVEFYYATKKTRCFMPPYQFCPHRIRLCEPERVPAVSRYDCDNCAKCQFKKTVKCRRRATLCLPCAYYFKLTRTHRPFLVPRESSSPLTKTIEQSVYEVVVANDQSNCYFQPRVRRVLAASRNWEPHEIVACVQAFKKYGKSPSDIVKELPGRNIYDVDRFYVNYRLTYRLDFLISLFRHASREDNTETAIDEGGSSVADEDSNDVPPLPSSATAVVRRNATVKEEIDDADRSVEIPPESLKSEAEDTAVVTESGRAAGGRVPFRAILLRSANNNQSSGRSGRKFGGVKEEEEST